MPFVPNDHRINRNGRPAGSKSEATNYRKALREAIKEKDIQDIINTLKHKAKNEQCIQAIKLILEYSLGKPTAHQVQHVYDHSESKPFDFNETIKKLRSYGNE